MERWRGYVVIAAVATKVQAVVCPKNACDTSFKTALLRASPVGPGTAVANRAAADSPLAIKNRLGIVSTGTYPSLNRTSSRPHRRIARVLTPQACCGFAAQLVTERTFAYR